MEVSKKSTKLNSFGGINFNTLSSVRNQWNKTGNTSTAPVCKELFPPTQSETFSPLPLNELALHQRN